MWALFVAVFYTSALPPKIVGSFEMRMDSQEQCLLAKEKFERDFSYSKHRVYASCTFKSYLQ